MPRISTLRVRLLLLAGAGLLVANVKAQSKCYNTWGEEDTSQQPCFAPGTEDTNATTWCCNKGDSCLSNGLCQGPEANSIMTQQGCTDKSWEGCNKICPAGGEEHPRDIALVPCAASFKSESNDIKFCCGPDPRACCEDSSSWITVSGGTIIRAASSIPPPSSNSSPQDTTTDSSSSSSSEEETTNETNNAPATTTNSNEDETNTTENNNNYSLKIGLGIGLGLGIPIFLVLLAVAYLLSQPLHRRRRSRNNRNRTKNHHHHPSGGGATTEKTSSSTSDTASSADTYPPRRTGRRKSFGAVDTRIRPSTDEEAARHQHHWGPVHNVWATPAGGPAGPRGVAAAVATWARSPFGFGGLEPPPSPKEMDGAGAGAGAERRRGSRSRMRGEAAELGSGEVDLGDGGDRGGRGRGWKSARGVVHGATEVVELPTPDTPEKRDVERGLKGESVILK